MYFKILPSLSVAICLALLASANPIEILDVDKRETACIALGDCPGLQPEPSSSSPPAPATTQPSTTTQAHSLAQPVPPASAASATSGGVAAATPVKRIFLDTDSCSQAQQDNVTQAWNDAALLARAAVGGRLDYDYNKPHQHWLGKWYDWGGWWPFTYDYADVITKDVANENTLHSDNVQRGIWIYLSCPKQHEVCTPGTIAASTDSTGTFWTNHYTIFCPRFFSQDSMTTSINKVSGNTQEQMVMDNYWGNQGYTFLHETYHYKYTVSNPRCKDYCYQAEACWDMAADPGRSTRWALETADSFTLYSTAVYMQQYFNTVEPPVPRKYTISQDNATVSPARTDSNHGDPPPNFSDPVAPAQPTQYYVALDDVPQDLFGTTNDVNVASSNPDPRWKVIVGPPVGQDDESSDAPPAGDPCGGSACQNGPPGGSKKRAADFWW